MPLERCCATTLSISTGLWTSRWYPVGQGRLLESVGHTLIGRVKGPVIRDVNTHRPPSLAVGLRIIGHAAVEGPYDRRSGSFLRVGFARQARGRAAAWPRTFACGIRDLELLMSGVGRVFLTAPEGRTHTGGLIMTSGSRRNAARSRFRR